MLYSLKPVFQIRISIVFVSLKSGIAYAAK